MFSTDPEHLQMLSRRLVTGRLAQTASTRFVAPRAAFSQARALRAQPEEDDPHLVLPPVR